MGVNKKKERENYTLFLLYSYKSQLKKFELLIGY